VIGADLEGLITSHNQTDFLGFAMSQDADVARTSLLPFAIFRVESEQLGAPSGFNPYRQKCAIIRSMQYSGEQNTTTRRRL
jgi:hypothetical protein